MLAIASLISLALGQACTDVSWNPAGCLCGSSSSATTAAGYCNGDAFAAITSSDICDHGEVCNDGSYCVESASTVDTATEALAASEGTGETCNGTDGTMSTTADVCGDGDTCDTAVLCLWTNAEGTEQAETNCATKCSTSTGCLAVCDASDDVATPAAYDCWCHDAATAGNGFCDFDGGFTAFSATNVCDHGALCAADNFCVKSDFAGDGSTTGTAAEGAADKFCDATTGTVIDKSTVCEVTKTCTSAAKQCLYADDTTKKNTECKVGQTCEYAGCEDSESDIDTSAIALSGLTGFLLTLVNVV